jgi:hypothetical protein
VPGRVTCKVLATIAGIGEDGAGGGGWERRSIGPGAHGMRDYDWTAVALDSHADTSGLPDGWGHWLLVRRQVQPAEGKTMRELAFYRCAGPTTNPLRELIRMAGARWAIEECFQTAKNEAGLDHYQVRIWRAWYAHITLAMLALAYLAATRAREHRNDHASEYCNSRSPGSSCSYPTVSRAGVCAGLRAVSGAVREFIDRSSTAQQERGRVPGQHVVQHPCWRRGWPARR